MDKDTNSVLQAALSKAYIALCALKPREKVFIQEELCACRDALALASGEDAEEVQDKHEEMAFNSPLRAHWL